MRQSPATAHWAARLAELAAATDVVGATLGIWANGQETRVAHGVLSTATGVAVTPESLFQIGSITKVWTATMIMQLLDAGRISLDATVAEVLPSVRLGAADVGSEVTVRHLLTHTSGIDGDIFADTGRGDDCVARYTGRLAEAVQTHPVGAAYSYCNSGFVLLGRIIEVLDGRVWDASLLHRLIEPLGLTQTVTLPEEAIMHRAAVGHRERPRSDEPVAAWALPRSLGPAGLITASAHDVLNFARAHLDRGVAPDGTRVLSEESVAAMQDPLVPIPQADAEPGAVGLAWRVFDWNGRKVVGHDGSTVGQSAYLRADPEQGVVACLLTNASNGDSLYRQIIAEVLAEYAGLAMPPGPEPLAGAVADGVPDRVAVSDLARHAGRYERTSRRYDVSLRDGRLHAVATPTGELAAYRDGELEDLDLYPADSAGTTFVCRSHDDEPWTEVSFGQLADGASYLYTGGRITLKSS
jgi:CubicO group peptidase (beta-lactamase class C family)